MAESKQELQELARGEAMRLRARPEPWTPPPTEQHPPPYAQYRSAILPTLGAVIGSRAGVPGAALGAMGGRALNAPLGLEAFDPSEIAKEGEFALLGGAAGAGLKAGFRAVSPWMEETLNRLAPERAAAFLARFMPTVAPKVLFQQAKQSGLTLPLPKTLAAADEMIGDLSGAGQTAEWKTAASYLKRQVQDRITTGNGQLDAGDVISLHQGLGDKVATSQGKAHGAYKKLYEALAQEVDDIVLKSSTGSPAASLITQAWRNYKRQATTLELLGNVKKATKVLAGTGEAVQFNGAEVVRNLQKNRFFTTAFTPAEQQEITKLLTSLNKIPALQPGAGRQFGSGRAFMREVRPGFAGGLVGHLGGQLVGEPVLGTQIGATAGIALPIVSDTLRNINVAIQTGIGRALLRELIKAGKGDLTPRAASVLAAYAAANQDLPGTAQAIEQAGRP